MWIAQDAIETLQIVRHLYALVRATRKVEPVVQYQGKRDNQMSIESRDSPDPICLANPAHRYFEPRVLRERVRANALRELLSIELKDHGARDIRGNYSPRRVCLPLC